MYVDFADFHLMQFRPAAAHLVAGFGRIVDLRPEDLLAPAGAAAALGAIDEGACRHMNEDHLDALALMATGRAVGVDPFGIDLQDGARTVRVEFDGPVTDGGGLRVALKRLADRVRGAGAA
jgi:putative heme iron utilization protein